MQCLSVRKRGSTDPCTARAVLGHSLCGRHAKSKQPVLWADANTKPTSAIVKCQGRIRGWLLRRRLAMSGPGVLSRKNLSNDEDLVTCVEKERQHPFDYFSFTENGKIWWFDFDTIWKWCERSHQPINPYTKVPIAVDALKRLHAGWGYRLRHRITTTPEETNVYPDRLVNRWNVICRIFMNYGFDELHPNMFLKMTKLDYLKMFGLLSDDIRIVFRDGDMMGDRIHRYCIRAQHLVHSVSTPQYPLFCTSSLLMMLMGPRDPYILCFTILSALYRC